mmetsp:Transcript_94696/g.138275  ORF Transcript_94696/g.138275 Transcript_94696/m.138275 type:complete len:81 (-) Transcript_94696:604-846(-)
MRASFFLCSQSRPIDEPSVPSKEPYIHSKEPYTHPQKSPKSLVHTEVHFTIRPIAVHIFIVKATTPEFALDPARKECQLF